MAGRPCLNCNPGNVKCRNSVEAVNKRIDAHNQRTKSRSSSRRMRAFLGMDSLSPLRHIAPQVDHDPPAAAMPGEDPILQLSFSDGEDYTASAQAGDTDAVQNDEISGAVTMTSGDTTTRLLDTERGGVDSVDDATEETEDAVPTAPPLADAQCDIDAAARFGDGVHNGGQHGVAVGDERGGDDGDAIGNGVSQDGGTTEDGIGAPPPDPVAGTAAADNPPPGDAGGVAVPPPATTFGQEEFTPRRWTPAELQQDDPLIQALTPANHKLMEAYGDRIHQNDGTHLDGGIGIGEDRLWQRLHRRIASCNLALYDLPNGRWADRFLSIQTRLWEDAQLRKCNSEKPFIFATCILRKVKNVMRFAEVKPLVWRRMDAWEEGQFVGLVKGVEEEVSLLLNQLGADSTQWC